MYLSGSEKWWYTLVWSISRFLKLSHTSSTQISVQFQRSFLIIIRICSTSSSTRFYTVCTVCNALHSHLIWTLSALCAYCSLSLRSLRNLSSPQSFLSSTIVLIKTAGLQSKLPASGKRSKGLKRCKIILNHEASAPIRWKDGNPCTNCLTAWH